MTVKHITSSDGLQPTSNGFHPSSDGLHTVKGLRQFLVSIRHAGTPIMKLVQSLRGGVLVAFVGIMHV